MRLAAPIEGAACTLAFADFQGGREMRNLLVGLLALLAALLFAGLVACNTEYGSGEICFMRHDDNDAAIDAGRARDFGITATVAGAASR
jgi:predicted small secreted protein